MSQTPAILQGLRERRPRRDEKVGSGPYTGGRAGLTEQADVMVSNTIVRKDVWVRIPHPALIGPVLSVCREIVDHAAHQATDNR